MAAVLADWGGYYSQRVYLSEARRMGLIIRPPQVNYSTYNFSARKVVSEENQEQKVLFMGLDQVKELTRRTIDRIIRQAPFHSLEDFLARVDPRRQEAQNLACVGALNGFGKIPAILHRLQKGGWQKGQMSLFDWGVASEEDWTLEQKITAQQELLGASLEAHPLELVAQKVAAAGAITTLEAVGRTGQKVTVAGVRQSSHHSRTAKGGVILFLALEDLVGTLEVILYPEVYRRAKAVLNWNAPMLVTGIIEVDAARGEPFLRAEKVAKLE
jgi:DNA polymerase III alpha subunit